MRILITLMVSLALSLVFLNASAQVTNLCEPVSWGLENKNSVAAITMPSIDFTRVAEEDAINDLEKSNPYRFGYELDTNLGLDNAGVWDILPNGNRIWRINITSENARSLSFIFDTYVLPEGASVYLYANDRQDMIGAYTASMNNAEKMLGTWMVEGESVWIEYYEPADVSGQGKLNIGSVIHGYRTVTESALQNRALNDSGPCNLDVDCTIGTDFDDKKDLLKHAVGLIAQGGFVCTGTLLNNTNLDKEPYFLFANHCEFTPSTSVFRFNWISPNPVCATNSNSTNSTFNSTSGAELLSTNSQSDYRLFKITGGLSNTWDLEWAGWDTSDLIPDYTVGIHHPAGDIMKVCRNDVGLIKQTGNGQMFWTITSAGGGWEMGVTEGGSSGSGLFNPEGQLIGTLCCGGASCAGTNDNDQADFYGRFAVSYNNNNLAQWLDPTNSGVTSLTSLSEELLGTNDMTIENNVQLYPNPSNGVVTLTIKGASGTDVKYTIFTIDGRNVANGSFDTSTTINMENQSNGVYFVKIEDTISGAVVTKKMLIKK